ncbi:MAG TPA: prenyltransferase/squalene oxidase repeat-containing protein [Planctomycetota bacterium]|nr:prenyltransferase/squalene oxidase repeat-containing protein [Planctomycetota bacterium]
MSRDGACFILSVLVALTLSSAGCEAPPGPGGETGGGALDTPLGRAVALLTSEVPRWYSENDCFSCHHNGDAARALFAAGRLGREVPRTAIASTVEWLARPDRWDDQKGDPAFSDKALARFQFAAALAGAHEAGLVREERAIESARDSLEALQGDDGAWTVEPPAAMGSPATWGTHLATAMTCRALEALGERRPGGPVERARSWLREAPVRNVFEAAAVLLGLGAGEEPGKGGRVEACLRKIEEGRSPRGGWGPYATSPPEPFDTAVVLLALRGLTQTAEVRGWIQEGRAYLLATQEEDGGWPATTRPPGGQSHAQSTSTTAWATMALLVTE